MNDAEKAFTRFIEDYNTLKRQVATAKTASNSGLDIRGLIDGMPLQPRPISQIVADLETVGQALKGQDHVLSDSIPDHAR